MPSPPYTSDNQGARNLTVALIGPDEDRRAHVAEALAPEPEYPSAEKRPQEPTAGDSVYVREFNTYPDPDALTKILEQDYDVIILDLDRDPELALGVVRSIAAQSATTVMVYSAKSDVNLVVRSMRAGAREFLNLPVSTGSMAEALGRVSVHKSTGNRPIKKTGARKLFVFLGCKGGCGVTTIASNFAVSVAQESGQSAVLIDLGVPLGDTAINLGVVPIFSTANALEDPRRLDTSFLSTLVVQHSSGLSVLAAPNEFPSTLPTNDGIDRVISLSRQIFDYVIIDAGSRIDLKGSAVFEDAALIYLVTQVGISSLRNANRMIVQMLGKRVNPIQIVLNRYTTRTLGFDEDHITKALTMAPHWRIPDDYAAAQKGLNTATAIAMEDSPISRAIRQMAKAACGVREDSEKKKLFGLFG
jgi:pilus assembly protein CpaE